MAERVIANFTGPALAFLLYENVNAGREQEGFLLGDIHVVRTNTITDTDSQNVETKRVINIKGVVSCPQTCLFYNSAGQVDKDKMKDILGPQISDVVAWFKYEPLSELRMTLRGVIVHKELSRCFGSQPEDFLCCLLTSSTSHNHSTHKYTHILKRYHNSQFETVSMHIENLGDPINCYKPNSQASKAFLDVYKSIGSIAETSNWRIVGDIQDKLQSDIMEVMAKLSISERTTANLEREVAQLRQQVEHRKTMEAEKERAAKEAKLAEEQAVKKVEGEAYETLYLLVDEENNEIEQRKPSVKTNKGTIETETNVMDASSTNSSTNNSSVKSVQLIDLTMSDGEETQSPTVIVDSQPTTRPKSYAQAALSAKQKNRNKE